MTVQVSDETHRRIHTAAVNKGMKLKEYVAAVLDAHAEQIGEVIVGDKETDKKGGTRGHHRQV